MSTAPLLNNANIVSNTNSSGTSDKWMSDLNKEDIELLNDLASLSKEQLMVKVSNLLDVAYQLGLEEC